MDTAILTGLMEAVQQKMPITFNYMGAAREVCPYMLGTTADKGIVLQAFQFGGASSKGVIRDPQYGEWKYFYIDKISGGIQSMVAGWYPAPKLEKAEPRNYVPPKFVTSVLALAKE